MQSRDDIKNGVILQFSKRSQKNYNIDQSADDLNERIKRIKKTISRINQLMAELRSMKNE